MGATDKFAGTLGRSNAAHLLRRAVFGVTNADIDRFAGYTVDQAMNELFADQSLPDPPVDLKTGQTWLTPKATDTNSEQTTLTDYFIIWFLEQIRNSGTSIRERLTYFYHTHIPTSRAKVKSSEMIYYQNALYRYFAFGSFKELFKRICIDNAMLVYLDNGTNDVSSPNENFAREMMELYSIGRGPQIGEGDYTNYTEDDVKAATRVLTGWMTDETFTNIDELTQIPVGKLRTATSGTDVLANRHDAGEKTFSNHFGNRVIKPAEVISGYATEAAATQELYDMLDMIFEQDATAQFITRKIYRYFVYYKIDDTVESEVIQPLAAAFKSSGYDMPTLVKALLSSQHFYDTNDSITANDIRGSIIKSPIELILGTANLFSVSFPTDQDTLYNTVYKDGILKFIAQQELSFFEPFEVAGYPAYHQYPVYSRNWITPNSLAYRYKFAQFLLNGVNDGGDSLGIQPDLLDWVKNSGVISDPSDAGEITDKLIELMIPFPVAAERRDFFLTDVFLDGLYPAAWTKEWNDYLASPSQYESSVRSQIEVLVNAIMQSPEYQLY